MINTKLLRQIADQIEKTPELYDQATWGFENPTPFDERGTFIRKAVLADPRDCGSPCCIAGWAYHLGKENKTQSVIRAEEDGHFLDEAATDLLGINQEQAEVLFDKTWSWDSLAEEFDIDENLLMRGTFIKPDIWDTEFQPNHLVAATILRNIAEHYEEKP